MYNINYVEPVFRPPSEWRSLIIQVANGCSWNNCTFCDMYTQPQKKFRPKPQKEIEQELAQIAASGTPVERIFLADGDAMTLSFRRLEAIMEAINRYFPNVRRVSSYCLPRNLKNKSVEELKILREMGLTLMYVGCESGDDQVLEYINKGETWESSLVALQKIKAAGMKSSVMILNGLGGEKFWEQHARNSASLMNEAQPEYLSTLIVMFHEGAEERFQEGFRHQWKEMDKFGMFQEMELMLECLNLERTIFRSDHASNYLVLKGTLGKDKQALLDRVRTAMHQPGMIPLRQEWQRAR